MFVIAITEFLCTATRKLSIKMLYENLQLKWNAFVEVGWKSAT